MPTETIDPPLTTSPIPSKPSLFASDEFENTMKEAIRATEAAALPPGVKDIAAVPEVKPAAPANDKPVETAPPEKTAPKDSDDEIPSDIKSPAAQSSWKKLKESKSRIESERDTIKKERDSARTELETLRKTASTPAQKTALADDPEYQQVKKALTEKEKELDDYSKRIQQLDVTHHPKFIEHFQRLTDAQHNIAKSIGGDKAMEILKLPSSPWRDQQLEELSAELTPFKAAQLATVMTRLEEINADRNSEIAKARDSSVQIKAEQEKQAEQQREEIMQTFRDVRSEVTDNEKGLAVFQERDGDTDWNKGVSERLALVDKAMSGHMQPEEIIRSAFWAASAPALLEELNGERERSAAKISELQTEIAKLRAVEPNPGGKIPGEGDTQTENPKRGMDGYMAAIGAALPGRA